eukprot:CAMPEP_0178822280 /NCGR_PEP_ID=MMETSP0746-20121128/4511_1 /TAXON_ID=913974 /ORGANISM="Nitzschia punctata, Strain CCMP561" /LENGTH=696 /DNA_ID=CAMNT_0020483781 /DNA_START=106 /DNA_END=2197 /DNA_ORIENTATION=-
MTSKMPSVASRNKKRECSSSLVKCHQDSVIIKIVSATYGPCESLLTDGNSTTNNQPANSDIVPLTRDCATFLRDLLVAAREREHQSSTNSRRQEAFVYLLGGGRLSMNAVFGDPCPGTSKRLNVHYIVTEITANNDTTATRLARTESHHTSFAEHERVMLRRRLTTQRQCLPEEDQTHASKQLKTLAKSECSSSGAIQPWSLRPSTSELLLPRILPFLDLWERIQCRVICRAWKKTVWEWGVATIIDANDPRTTNTGSTSSNSNKNFTRPILRGLLAHSYTSLHSLFLSGFQELEKQDLHPAIPHLRNLRTLDVTRCTRLDDLTLKLLAEHVSSTLQVLYLKGLHKVTDIGLESICKSCTQLEVLDLSQVVGLTDRGGKRIQNLKGLRALFLRDNYQLTNGSLDEITQKCNKLTQLSLWGMIRLQHLKIGTPAFNSGRLFILNLWGCHSLRDDAAHALGNMSNLNSLIVSECHRLTDAFIETLVSVTGLQEGLRHLHLRYLKKISDKSISAIAANLRLYSLDLSFCSQVTSTGIYRLLEDCRDCLVELRLKCCRNLQIGSVESLSGGEVFLEAENWRRMQRQQQQSSTGLGRDGNWILNALRRPPHCLVDHTLCVLDVRQCGGQPVSNVPYPDSDPFVIGMAKLNFEQVVPGFFSEVQIRPGTALMVQSFVGLNFQIDDTALPSNKTASSNTWVQV